MQQHLMQMQPMMAAYYPNNVTTDHIQQYLDENKSLILKIVESQSSGKLTECAENQARLQRNLMYLAAIADSQPQPPTVHAQYSPTGIVQPGANYLHHQQAQQMSQQSLMAARSSLLYTQQPYAAMQQQQLHGQLGMNSGGSSSDLQMMHSEAAGGAGCGGSLVLGGFPDFGRGKQDVGSSGGRAGSSGCQNGNGGDNLYLKVAKDPN